MTDSHFWLSEKEASKVLRVDGQILESLRKAGYLKPGSHWRSSTDPKQLPWNPKALYSVSRCKQVIECWMYNDSSLDQIAA
tara:strand:- start:172 stop:414 length:243 start_codon:yes stop_codon:yes gene_type:complete